MSYARNYVLTTAVQVVTEKKTAYIFIHMLAGELKIWETKVQYQTNQTMNCDLD